MPEAGSGPARQRRDGGTGPRVGPARARAVFGSTVVRHADGSRRDPRARGGMTLHDAVSGAARVGVVPTARSRDLRCPRPHPEPRAKIPRRRRRSSSNCSTSRPDRTPRAEHRGVTSAFRVPDRHRPPGTAHPVEQRRRPRERSGRLGRGTSGALRPARTSCVPRSTEFRRQEARNGVTRLPAGPCGRRIGEPFRIRSCVLRNGSAPPRWGDSTPTIESLYRSDGCDVVADPSTSSVEVSGGPDP